MLERDTLEDVAELADAASVFPCSQPCPRSDSLRDAGRRAEGYLGLAPGNGVWVRIPASSTVREHGRRALAAGCAHELNAQALMAVQPDVLILGT